MFYFVANCFSFPVDDCYYLRCPTDVIKIGDKIGMHFNDCYQIRNISDFIIDSDGWYNTEFCGTAMYVIYGSNYFAYFSNKDIYYPESPSKFNFGSSFLNQYEENEYIKSNLDDSSWGWTLWPSAKVEVPDFLVESNKNGKTVYNDYDLTHYFYYLGEGGLQLFRQNSVPWATSKEPKGMQIEVDLFEKTNSFVILNGYVNPLKRYLYKANRRLKKIRITSPESDFSSEINFEDVVHFQEIKLPQTVQKVTIELLDYYEGNKYKDLCVQMIGNKNTVFEARPDCITFDDLSYNGEYKEFK